ncbi:MAG: peptide chain release factor 1 [Deltaproteobacteria bacterium]|nr:peptide chain release factor 1 [Deltaproteobacteria bacterium]
MFERLEEVQPRIEEIESLLATPEVVRDRRRANTLGRELTRLKPLAQAYAEWKEARRSLLEARTLQGDPEMHDLAQEEIEALEARIPTVEARIRRLLLPPDPYEGRNVILEIRAGTGGDEAALFAGVLFRMYGHYCEAKRWSMEVFSLHEVFVGGGGGRTSTGYKEILCRISGETAYAFLRFESGVHRVQRVPLTEAQGRIHTSAATVAVLPEAEEVEVHIDPGDLRIDVMRAGGPGGQSVNTTDSAVRITHIPTGLVVICQDEKSQHKNKARALQVLAARLLQIERDRQQAEEAANRRAQVGTGDRSERIRTYNFPQNRVTDHRVNLTLYRLDGVLEGDLDEIVTALQAWHQAERLQDQDLDGGLS